jgi:hypothetical protein
MVASAEARHGSLFGNQCAHRRQIICMSGAHILGLPESFSHTHTRLQAESDLDVLSTHFAHNFREDTRQRSSDLQYAVGRSGRRRRPCVRTISER